MHNRKIKIFLILFSIIIIVVSLILFKYYYQEFICLKSRKEIVFLVDDSFSKEEFIQIKRAGKDWVDRIDTLKITFKLKRVNWYEMFSFGADGNAVIYNAYSFGIKREAGRALGRSFKMVGMAVINSGDIFILRKLNIYQTTKHEIGHILLGSTWHSADPNSIMYPYLNNNREIKQEEINLIREKNNEYFP